MKLLTKKMEKVIFRKKTISVAIENIDLMKYELDLAILT